MLKSLQVFTSKKNKRVIIDKTTPMNDFGLDQRDDEETKMSLNVWKHIEIIFCSKMNSKMIQSLNTIRKS